jgi:hypothetical protein
VCKSFCTLRCSHTRIDTHTHTDVHTHTHTPHTYTHHTQELTNSQTYIH